MNKTKQFLSGIKAGIPVMIGFLPIAITFAMLALKTGLTASQTNMMSVFVLAGASQMMAVNMLSLGAGAFEIVFATFILNLRHVIMSFYVMNRLKDTPTPLKLILSFGITDETFAILSTKIKEEANAYFFAGLAAMTYGSWVIGTVIGSALVSFIPQVVLNSMSIALYAMFIGLLMPSLKINFPLCFIVLASVILNTILRLFLSAGWAIIISTVVVAYIGARLHDKLVASKEVSA